ncbi:MAG: UDP-N-acetylmuramoyl-L-alanine--D-glutamate ligase [Thermodesulfobacteriota bacterium]
MSGKDQMELEGRKTLVVGLGKTGRETVKFLLGRKAEVRATDLCERGDLSAEALGFEVMGVKIETGEHKLETFLWADTVVMSPGVPLTQSVVQESIKRGAEVISELELASRFLRKPVVALTGSNGKTTTTTLITAILRRGGKKVFLGGNIGTPAIEVVDSQDTLDVIVLETSSFQLQGTDSFRPDIGVILNISPNHLDHHLSLEEYVDSKMKLFANQNEGDFAIYNSQDALLREKMESVTSNKIPYGTDATQNGLSLRCAKVTFRDETYDLSRMRLPGEHNMENAMAAIAAATLLGCPKDIIEREILSFAPLEHRINLVAVIEGAKFYNDSKSTSPSATLRALQSLNAPVILIAGGKDKGASYGALGGEVKNKVKLLILMGEAKHTMKHELGELVETSLVETLDEAVGECLKNLRKGDNVLFSPACSSFDMFSSYEERGRRFSDIVQNIRL